MGRERGWDMACARALRAPRAHGGRSAAFVASYSVDPERVLERVRSRLILSLELLAGRGPSSSRETDSLRWRRRTGG